MTIILGDEEIKKSISKFYNIDEKYIKIDEQGIFYLELDNNISVYLSEKTSQE